MKTTVPPMAKIGRPKVSSVVPRERLFTLLDTAREKPVIWVSAPAGSGKTTLITTYLDQRKLPCLWYQVDEGDADISSFFYYMGLSVKNAFPRKRTSLPLLTPEYFPGLTTFTRRYFESLYTRLKLPSVLVFDNYQEVPFDTKFHEIMREGISSVPAGITIIVISRGEPPPVFARLQASNSMSFIGWEEVKFDITETNSLGTSLRSRPLSDEYLKELYRWTEGWAAGIVLILARIKTDMDDFGAFHHVTRKEVFDYFAEELFKKTSSETRDFLLASALLPTMTAEEADELAGNNASASILESMSRTHFFTERHFSERPVYQYHPLFREFLLNRAEETLSAERMLELQRNAAALLERSGRMEPAAELMCKTGDWNGLARLVGSCAQLFIAQGRAQTLEGWLRSFPEGFAEQCPWLEYWLGVCRLPFNPAEGQIHFERSFEYFRKNDDPAGQFLSWAGIADSIFFAWSDLTHLDPWFPLLDELLQRQPVFPSLEIEALVSTSIFCAVLYRNPVHEKLVFWEDRLNKLFNTIGDSRLRIEMGGILANYYVWLGEIAKASRLIDMLQTQVHARNIPPLMLLKWSAIEALYRWVSGDLEGCRKTVANGLDIATSTGVHILDFNLLAQGTYSVLIAGDLGAGTEYLDRIRSLLNSSSTTDTAYYHYLAGWGAFLSDDIPRAFDHAQLSLSLSEKSGGVFLQALDHGAMAQLLMTLKKYPEAAHNIEMARRIGHDMRSSAIDMICLMSEARLALAQNDNGRCLASLGAVFSLGKTKGNLNCPWLHPNMMSILCAKALEAGIEVEYVQRLVKNRRLATPDCGITLENWPWALKIYMLGRFQIVRDGEPVYFSGKVQQKPLALLKALIAFGGVDVAEEQITDALWPDVDGDMAHRSFEMALHRLRKLLGHDKAIRLQERHLTLDPHLCWVDVRALGDLLEKADAAWKDPCGSTLRDSYAVQLSERAAAMYRGPFLPNDSAHPWVLSSRERLRSRFLRLLVRLGDHRKQAEQWESAVEVYQKGLEVDGLAEEFYQHLMVCYQQLGRRSEAISTYNLCRSHLSSMLGIAPSFRTETLYQSIINRQ